MIALLVATGWMAVLVVVVALCHAAAHADRAADASHAVLSTDPLFAELVPAPVPTSPTPRGVGQPAGEFSFRGLLG
jgi:hypothetical protein